MRAFLAKDQYGVTAFIEEPELVDYAYAGQQYTFWKGKAYDFTTELTREIERIGADLVECKEVKEVEIIIKIDIIEK